MTRRSFNMNELERPMTKQERQRTTKDTQVKIVHTQGLTSYKTFSDINKLFPDHLECLSVIRASLSECHNVAFLPFGGGGAPAKPAWRRLAAAEMHYVETCVSLEILKLHLSLKMCYFAIGHTRAHEEES